MTRKTNALDQLIELARYRSDSAARALAGQLQCASDERAKLDLLVRYRREYEEQFSKRSLHGMLTLQWRGYHEFIAKIDAAIRSQHEAVEHHELKSASVRKEWQQADRKLKSFDTLAERRLNAASRAQARREQDEQDELAGSFARRAPTRS